VRLPWGAPQKNFKKRRKPYEGKHPGKEETTSLEKPPSWV